MGGTISQIWGLKLRNIAEEKRCTALSFCYIDAVICVCRIVNDCAVFDILLRIFKTRRIEHEE